MSNRRWLMISALCALAAAATLALVFTSRDGAQAHADAPPPGAADAQRVATVATQNSMLIKLKGEKPSMDLDSSYLALADDEGQLWVMPSVDGKDLCVTEVPTQGDVYFRFVCNDTPDVNQEGLVGGVPGHWFGLAPQAPADAPRALMGSTGAAVTVLNRAFRAPSAATAITLGGVTRPLPGPWGG